MPTPKHTRPVAATVNCNELLEQLRKIALKQPDTIPPEFKTSEEWAKLWKMKRRGAEKLLVAGVRAGKIVKKKFRVFSQASRTQMVFHYAPA